MNDTEKKLMEEYLNFVGLLPYNYNTPNKNIDDREIIPSFNAMNPDTIIYSLNLQAEKEASYLETPARIQWEVTDICNLNCSHCYINSNKDKTFLPLETCISFVQEFKNNGVLRVEIQGGEPLVRSDIFDILFELKKNFIPYSLLTNGTKIDSIMAKKLAQVLNPKTDKIQISLDGSSPAVNDIVRSKGSFNKIIKGIYACKEQGVPFNVNFTISDLNVHDLFNTYKLVDDIKAAISFTFFTLMNVGRGRHIRYSKHKTAIKEVYKIHQFYKNNKGVSPRGSIGYIQHLPFYEELLRTNLPPNFKFSSLRYLGRSSMNVNHIGNCYPASYLQDEAFNAGNLTKLPLKKIWHSDKWRQLRDYLNKYPEECCRCNLFNFCAKGSMAAIYQEFKCFDKVDPHCNYFYKQNPTQICQQK